jgi:hypothetical protein
MNVTELKLRRRKKKYKPKVISGGGVRLDQSLSYWLWRRAVSNSELNWGS